MSFEGVPVAFPEDLSRETLIVPSSRIKVVLALPADTVAKQAFGCVPLNVKALLLIITLSIVAASPLSAHPYR